MKLARGAGRGSIGTIGFALLAACSGAPPAVPATAEPNSSQAGPAAAIAADPALVAAPPATPAQPDVVPTDLPGVEAAIGRGAYVAATRALETMMTGADVLRAQMLMARLQLDTGRYAECEAMARQVAAASSSNPAMHRAAVTLQAEAILRQGKLDDGERLLASLTTDASAFRAHVLLGRLMIDRGRDAEAQAVLMTLIDAYNDDRISDRDAEGLTYVGMAAWGLGSFQDANEAFRDAARADATRVETQLEWAQLFMEKYDTGHAEECVREALEHNPHSALGRALLARIKLEQTFDFPGANEETDAALTTNPNLVLAHVTRAGMALRDMDIRLADEHISRALNINANDLEALSVRAAIRFLADDAQGFERAKSEVFRRNRRYSRMYSIIGDYADWEHRYPEIVRMAREAVTLNSDDALAHATLGLNLLRMGEETEGLAALRDAWSRDHFNVHVYNTLNFYDNIVTREYEEFQAAPFVMRMHRDERPALEPYVVPTLRRAYADMVRRYGFTPEGPVRIEMFASPEHFSIRTTGLPNVGVQGVCFGKVVTAISPAGGPFNWGNIIWHELAHVFHIQLSHNHVPRWFTEGLAEYETIVARPEWKREDDATLYLAMQAGRFPAIRDMNSAFTHVRHPQQILTAYYGSSQIIVYLVGRYGFEVVPRMLREWGQGASTSDVISRVLHISAEQLDSDFRAHTLQRLAAYATDFAVDPLRYLDVPPLQHAVDAAPQDAHALAALAMGQLQDGHADTAVSNAQRALRLDAHEPVAHFLLARYSLSRNDAPRAEAHVQDLIASQHDGYEVRMLSARIAAAKHDSAGMRAALEAAIRIDGERAGAWQGLLELAEQAHDDELKLRALDRIAHIDQHDRAANDALLDMLATRGRWADAIPIGEMGLFVNPGRAETHRILGEAYVRTNHAQQGLVELDQALRLHPEHPGPIQVGRVRALVALRRTADARQAAQEATRADPSLAGEVGTLLGTH
ncbi:MAG: hypothetical protein IPK60_08335 [Sandaracinaceae bacterium]|nr:hypothetical protein [Sandaracinaceae bacterium]